MNTFMREFSTINQAIGSLVGAQDMAGYTENVERATDDLTREILRLARNNKDLDYAKGDVFEAWHAGTFNLDAVRRHLGARAITPRDASIIDVSVSSPHGTAIAQLKDYKTAADTAKAISEPKYRPVDQKIVPSDQLEGVHEQASRLAAKNHLSRPEMEDNYGHTARTADDRLRAGGATSKPITEEGSRHLTQTARQESGLDREGLGLTPQQVIEWQDLLRETTTAATRAAMLSAALQLAPHIIDLVMKLHANGEINWDDLAPIGKEVPMAAIRSGLSGGLSAAIIAASRMGALGQAASQLDPSAVAVGVTLAISAIGTSVRAARGQISWPMATKTMVEDTLVLSCAMGAAVLGQASIPIPLVGAILGNIVGAAVARLAIGQANTLILGIAEDTGWTFFGIVDQDYRLPESVLRDSGWEVFEVDRFVPEQAQFERLEVDAFELERCECTVLRRGVVALGRIGYLPVQ